VRPGWLGQISQSSRRTGPGTILLLRRVREPRRVAASFVHLVVLENATMKNLLVRFIQEDEGQDLVEYALLITFIALACIIGMQQLGTAINNRYNSISSSLAS
jgi:pilus assembly protein Flp/PilA